MGIADETRRCLVTDSDPGVVFSVKELIGRLEGKLDAFIAIIDKKAGKEDVDVVHRRVDATNQRMDATNQRISVVEDVTKAIQTLISAQATATAERDAAVERVRETSTNGNRFVITTIIAVLTMIIAGLAILLTTHTGGTH